MTVQANKREPIGIKMRTKALAAGMLVAAMMAASLAPASPAQATTTFTVNETGDFPDAFTTSNTCDTDVFTGGDQCSLRAAIQQANATAGADLINFAIPGTGVKTITVGSQGLGPLPPITEQVTIDGYTQAGASPNTKAVGDDAVLKIELTQTNVPGANGLVISDSSNSVIRGLVINRFGTGIFIDGNSVGNRIEGNFLGTDPTGTLDRGNNFDGVNISEGPSENVVGGSTPAARNVISANGGTGVFLDAANANRIQGNYIGTDKGGTKDLGNDSDGVVVESASDTTLGGTTAASRNVISANGHSGVFLINAQGTQVLGNRVGTTASGTGALGNDLEGVAVAASNNHLGDGTSRGSNIIAFNGQDGVRILTGAGNTISRNSLFSNAGLGIDLSGGVEDAAGNTANDPGDADPGPNGLQNKPVITTAKNDSGATTVKAQLNSTPAKTFIVQFFSNPSGEEGKKFIGQKLVTTDPSGNVVFTFKPASKVATGQTITATATDASSGDTSEFSAPRKVASS
jgi:hypothetical protein